MFNAYMNDSVVLIRKSGERSWGEREITRKTVRAKIEDKDVMIYTAPGESKMLKALVFIKEVDVNPSDRIEINGIEHPILTIKKHRSFSKTVIVELGIG